MFHLPETGLYLTHYRLYDPDTGRWLNRDPIGEEGGINLYAYVEGNPVNFVDPTGEFAHASIGGFVGGLGNLGYQLYQNGGNLDCVNWWQVGAWALAGSGVTGLGKFALAGREISIGKNIRVALFGNRTGHPIGKYPHYHRRGLGADGKTVDGQDIKRHRPWERKTHDKSWTDRF
jgi:RHS repeat-associated protein